MRARAAATIATDGIPLELQPMLSPYGRDRRVALRIERMPGRARLSRGRNNGDGSWSLTRDELDDLVYLPPKGATEPPTLVVRIIGLDSDDGATLSVLDYPVLPLGEAGDSAPEEVPEIAAAREAELLAMRTELAKAKAALRASHAELAASRKARDAELDGRLDEAASEAAAALEEKRAAWQAELKERVAKAESRAQERVEQARARWQREAEADAAKAEESWKSGETARLAIAEARWREQSARALAKETARLKQLESELAAARAEGGSRQSDTTEFRRLREEIASLQSAVSEREKKLADAQASATGAREHAREEIASALAKAEERWKAAEATRLGTAETRWREESQRALKEAAERIEEMESALANARAETKSARERRDSAELRRLRTELDFARETIADRDKQILDAETAAGRARKRSEDVDAALAKAQQIWKAGEATRLAAAEADWQEQSVRAMAELVSRLERSEAALAARSETESARGRRESAEIRRLKDALGEAQAKLARQEHAPGDAEPADTDGSERARAEFETALAEAKKEWQAGEALRLAEAKAQWQKQSDRMFKKATVRLEGAEAALAEARAEANTARDRRESAEMRRLCSEFAAARATLAEREAELAEAQQAAGRAKERSRDEVEAALAKAEELWKASEAIRIAEAENRERERASRGLSEAIARLERTESALTESRTQLATEKERSAIAMAETVARLERTESALLEARNRIETLRDPANESELARLRTDLAALQIAYADQEAELGRARSAARKVRDGWTERTKATLQRAEDGWRIEEAERLAAARREWERDARFAGAMGDAPEALSEAQEVRRANRLALDSALAVVLATLVVLGVTFYPRVAAFWPNAPAGTGIGMTKATAAAAAPGVANAAQPSLPHTTVAVSAANLRALPASGSHILATLSRGAGVTLVEQHNGWAHIRTDGESGKPPQDGWIRSTSLKQIAAR